MDNERLQEIKKGDWLLHGTEEWTNQEDADIEAVIKELVTALEAAQQELAEANETMRSWKLLDETGYKWVKEVAALRAQLAEAQAEVERLQSILDEHGSFCKAYIGEFVIKEHDPR